MYADGLWCIGEGKFRWDARFERMCSAEEGAGVAHASMDNTTGP